MQQVVDSLPFCSVLETQKAQDALLGCWLSRLAIGALYCFASSPDVLARQLYVHGLQGYCGSKQRLPHCVFQEIRQEKWKVALRKGGCIES